MSTPFVKALGYVSTITIKSTVQHNVISQTLSTLNFESWKMGGVAFNDRLLKTMMKQNRQHEMLVVCSV